MSVESALLGENSHVSSAIKRISKLCLSSLAGSGNLRESNPAVMFHKLDFKDNILYNVTNQTLIQFIPDPQYSGPSIPLRVRYKFVAGPGWHAIYRQA